jgi:AraC-like DNA-binding protein
MMPATDKVRWPLREFPQATTAGRFPLDDDAHRTTYKSPTNALHLHGYHGEMRIGGRTFNLSPGDITLSPARLPSSYALQRPGFHWCIHFLPASNRLRPAAEIPLHFPTGSQGAFAAERFRRISGTFVRARSGSLAAISVSLLVQELLLWIAEQAAGVGQSHAGPQKIDHALDALVGILQSRFTENLSVPQLAQQLAVSQNYLARRFRERFGATIPHYLVARRIEHACYLLTSTDMPVRRVAERVGMADAQYFNKQFRRFTGQSPSAYRESTRQRSSP